ncbi:axial budding pattern protein 2, partial [Phenoliferia sp. Uapishka_3]
MTSSRPRAGANLVLLLLLACLTLVTCAPSPANLVYPLQDQRPPVARVNETWSWTLLPGTFNASSGATLSLSSHALPAWATFDAATWSFAGFPSLADVGSHQVTIQANVSGVAQGTLDSFNLLVVNTPAPYVKLSLAAQLPSASSLGDGTVLTPDGGLELPPNWSFSLGFQQYTFQVASLSTIYYTAFQAGTTELPVWLKFDNKTVTFDGLAPLAKGEYTFTVVGSDYFGYGDIEQTLRISVGYHSFELLGNLPGINSSAGATINYTVPISSLYVDNTTVTSSTVSVSVALSAFPYLNFNPTTRVLSGTLPSSLAPANLSLPFTFTDQYNDTLNATVPLVVRSGALFTTSVLPLLTVYTGKPFSVNLSSYATDPSANYSAIISPSAAEHWLSFDAAKLILSGTAPSSIPSYKNASFVVTATDSATARQNSASLAIVVAESNSTTPSSSGGLPTAPVDSSLSNSTKLAIGLALGLGIPLLIAVFCCWKNFCRPEKRVRRDHSTLIFDQATIAAAQKATPDASTGKTFLNTPDTQKYGEKGRMSIDDSAAARDATAAANEAAKPKRIGLMGLFRGASTPKKGVSAISLPIQSQNSLYGLGIADEGPKRHNIIVVTDGEGGTYAAGAGASGTRVAGDSDHDRSSSWESGGSSSLFYSDNSDAEGGRRARGPPSAPRQRRDFLPLPIPRNISSPIPTPSSSASGDAIRMVSSTSGGTEESSGSGQSRGRPAYDNSTSSYPDLPAASGSMASIPAPRLIPFTSERQASQSSNDRRHSQKVLPTNRSSAVMDADEDLAAWNRRSALYKPASGEGSPTTSAVYFETPRASAITDWLPSPAMSDTDEGEGVRLVGTTNNSPAPSAARSTWAHQRNPSASTYNEPSRTYLEVGRAFRFTPTMHPPPFVSITSSPGRGGPPRATYHAFVDDEDEPGRALPNWVHFDQSSLQVFGKPRDTDVGALHFYIVERKTMQTPGSPTRRGTPVISEPMEQIVGRYVLDVSWPDEEEGVLQVISY